MMGQFDFEDVAPEGPKGQLFLAFYLLVTLVLLLNFIIAILSETYVRLRLNALGLYLESLLDELPKWRYAPRRNVLTFRVPPFNFLTLLALPLLRFQPVRRMLETAYYLPSYGFYLLILLVLNVLLFVPCWAMLLLSTYRAPRRPRACLHFWAFPLLFPALLSIDIALACSVLWRHPAVPESSHARPLLLRRDMELLMWILQQDYAHYSEAIPLSMLLRHVREAMGFTCNLQDFAQVVYSRRREESPARRRATRRHNFIVEEPEEKERFDALKAFLAQNSCQDESGGPLQIYPGALLQALLEVCTMKAVTEREANLAGRATPSPGPVEFVQEPAIYRMNLSRMVRRERQHRAEGEFDGGRLEMVVPPLQEGVVPLLARKGTVASVLLR